MFVDMDSLECEMSLDWEDKEELASDFFLSHISSPSDPKGISSLSNGD
jgi:hypothetical protein